MTQDEFEDALMRDIYPEGFPPPGMSGSALALLEAHFRERHGSQERGMEAMRAQVALAFRRQGKTGFWLELLGVLPDEEP